MNKNRETHNKYEICNVIQKIALLICGISVAYFAVQLTFYNSTLFWEERMSLPYTKLFLIIAVAAVIILFVSTKLKQKYK